MFCQPENKLSLKNAQPRLMGRDERMDREEKTIMRDDRSANEWSENGSRVSRNLSLDKHEHRFRFMMQNLDK